MACWFSKFAGVGGADVAAGDAVHGDLSRGIIAVGSNVFQRAVLGRIVRAQELEREDVVHRNGPGERAVERGVGPCSLGGESAQQVLSFVHGNLISHRPGGVEGGLVQVQRFGAHSALAGGDRQGVRLRGLYGLFGPLLAAGESGQQADHCYNSA